MGLLAPVIKNAVVGLDKIKLLKTPVQDLDLKAAAQALAIFKAVDVFLSSKSRVSPGRLDALIERLTAYVAALPDSACEIERTDAGKIKRVEIGGVRLSLSVSGGERVFDAVQAEAVCEASGVLHEAIVETRALSEARLLALVQEGVISEAVADRLYDRKRVVSEEKVAALAILGRLSDEAVARCYGPGKSRLALRHDSPGFVKGLLK